MATATVYFKGSAFSKKWVQYDFTNQQPPDNDTARMKTTVDRDERKNVGSTNQDIWYRSDPDSFDGCYNKLWTRKSNFGGEIEIDV
jgi:hypothetical protein